ncbi:carbohydrate ABC transporter permease [Clostridium sp. SYSU_GA19001]|uniref:carbohydrate ABC transporter permease n=1 Tax=Clostridium caldaquaticum TaxID=2940653 RepID=UPI0020773AC7|nr:carbohydrate ABC transporter permease [Clostridium caldaquaticum]MCM8709940.1 carbohydrate ABC transporter permease [Clostridium caldaquaticum]
MENSSVKTREDRIYQFIIVFFLSILALCALLPFLLLLSSSITDESTLLSKGYSFIPIEISFYSYVYLFSTNAAKVFRAYGITFFITIAGTALSLLIGPMLAWPLSRSDYKRSKILTFMVFFTMLFNGGIVPSYIMWTQIFHIKNTIFALIFPSLLFNGFYIILYKNYFSSAIHNSLIEAARIDGAGEFYIYFKIVLPLSLPIIATIGLMVGIGYWNDWTNSLYYISDTKMYPLQQYLKTIIDNISALSSMSDSADAAALAAGMPGSSIRMALAVVGIIPIMVLYPFFQKAFIAGITLGGVKE